MKEEGCVEGWWRGGGAGLFPHDRGWNSQLHLDTTAREMKNRLAALAQESRAFTLLIKT